MGKKSIIVSVALLLIVSACSTATKNQMTLTGTVMTGAQLGDVKQHCAEGLYLVAEDGYLVGQTTMLLLRVPDQQNGSVMLSDPQFVGKQVEVTGKYPAQEVFCDALICACEDFILVTEINLVNP